MDDLMTTDQASTDIDSFHLLIEGLKLNGIETIYALPGMGF